MKERRGHDGRLRPRQRGQIHGRGTVRRRLAFDAVGDVVLIPRSAALDLPDAMTLEAWIYLTAAQSGWRAVLQKQYDTYLLLAGSRAARSGRGRRHVRGVHTEVLTNRAVVPAYARTHVTLTYDGAVLQLYINGRFVTRRLRWYPGRVVSAAVEGLVIPSRLSAESRRLRARRPCASTRWRWLPCPSWLPRDAPRCVTKRDPSRARRRRRPRRSPPDAGRSLGPRQSGDASARDHARSRSGDGLAVTILRTGQTYCVDVNACSVCGLRFTLGMGWTFFAEGQISAGWLSARHLQRRASCAAFPFGLWLRCCWESLRVPPC